MSDTVKMGAVARDLLRVHGLAGAHDGPCDRRRLCGCWDVIWDHTLARGGQCRYSKREIGLSGPLFNLWTDAQCVDKIAHEIAHALTPGHGHDAVWRETCIRLGGTGDRYWGSMGEEHLCTWVGTCPNGHEHRGGNRQPKPSTCGWCNPYWDERYLVTWRRQSLQEQYAAAEAKRPQRQTYHTTGGGTDGR